MLYLPLKYADKATHAVTVGEYCEDILGFSINICFFLEQVLGFCFYKWILA